MDNRASGMVARMSLEEKVAQLGSLGVQDLLVDGKFSEEKARQLLAHGIGQITRVAGSGARSPREVAELANHIQKFLVEHTRLGIPAIVHEECLSGFMTLGATNFPQAIGLASTWDPELLTAVTTVIRGQMRAAGAHQGLAPVLDVARDPRWGRVEETLGEDPYLVASLGVAYVKGLQGSEPESGEAGGSEGDARAGVMATLKHLAGYSTTEGGRNCSPAHIGPRELRDVFLFPFEAAVKEGKAESVINAYHDIDGIPCVASRELFTETLRRKWQFGGVVVSDYGSIEMLRGKHGVADTKEEAARLALEAGIDVELPAIDCYGSPLLEAVKEGAIPEALVDRAAERHLAAKMRLGLFEHPYVDPSATASVFDTPTDRELALQAATESLVLLTNRDGFLPLARRIGSVAVIGPSAASTRNLLGDYSFTVNSTYGRDAVPIVSILEGIREAVSPDTVVRHAQGCTITDSSTEGFAEAVEVARASEAAIVIVGERSGWAAGDTTGEGHDRPDLELPGAQQELVRAICETGTPVVVVLANGRPLSLGGIAEHARAMIESWFPGEEGGRAVARAIFGLTNPGGRLPVSFPRTVGQAPVHYSRVPLSLGDYVFTDSKPLFPFGHGLSYTRFEYRNLRVSAEKVKPKGRVTVRVQVKNAGKVAGDEVVQVYVRDLKASVTRPVKELKGFRRITLAPGKSRNLRFIIFADQLAFHDREMNLVVEPGAFEIMVGSSSEDIRLTGRFEVVGKKRKVAGKRRFFSEASG